MSKDNFFEGFESHTLAKLELYRRYLSVYFRIMLNSDFFPQINIFDFFCGKGKDENGVDGSPLVAINEALNYVQDENKINKQINFYFNDSDAEKIETLKRYVQELQPKIDVSKNELNVITDVGDGVHQLRNLTSALQNSKPFSAHNLFFIDPFGYKGILRQTLIELINCPKTEILLFMPVSNIYRFFNKELLEEGSMNTPALTDFVNSFFRDSNLDKLDKINNVDDFIFLMRESLRFDKNVYCSVLKIKNSPNYNALFFITKSLKGLGAMLSSQWSVAPEDGYEVGNNLITIGLFDQHNLEGMIKEYLQEYRTNRELYEYILVNDRLPEHFYEILKKFERDNNLEFVFLREGKRRKNTYYLTDKAYSKEPPKYKVRWRNPQ